MESIGKATDTGTILTPGIAAERKNKGSGVLEIGAEGVIDVPVKNDVQESLTSGAPSAYHSYTNDHSAQTPIKLDNENGNAETSTAEKTPYSSLDPVLRIALFDPKNRMFVLRLEKTVLSLLRNRMAHSVDLDPMNSYFRLISHKVAEYYCIGHSSGLDGTFVIYFKQAQQYVLPHVRLSDIENPDSDDSFDNSKDSGSSTPTSTLPIEAPMKKLLITKRPAVLLKKDKDDRESISRQSSASPSSDRSLNSSSKIREEVKSESPSGPGSASILEPLATQVSTTSASPTSLQASIPSESSSPLNPQRPTHVKILTNYQKSTPSTENENSESLEDPTVLSSDDSDTAINLTVDDGKTGPTLKGLSFEAKVAAYEEARARIFKNFVEDEEEKPIEASSTNVASKVANDKGEYSRDYVRSYTPTASRNDNPSFPTDNINSYSNRSNLSDSQLYSKFESAQQQAQFQQQPIQASSGKGYDIGQAGQDSSNANVANIPGSVPNSHTPLPYNLPRTNSTGTYYQYPSYQNVNTGYVNQQPSQPYHYQSLNYQKNATNGSGYLLYSPPTFIPGQGQDTPIPPNYSHNYNSGSYFTPQHTYNYAQPNQQSHQYPQQSYQPQSPHPSYPQYNQSYELRKQYDGSVSLGRPGSAHGYRSAPVSGSNDLSTSRIDPSTTSSPSALPVSSTQDSSRGTPSTQPPLSTDSTKPKLKQHLPIEPPKPVDYSADFPPLPGAK